MTMKNIQCSLVGLGRMIALRAQGWCGFDGITNFVCRGLMEDDSAIGPGNGVGCITSWAWGGRCCCMLGNGITGMGMTPAWSMESWAHVGEDGGT
jgi:hypothetical protein